jgi:drug/metabolite transporter (DMT)-like permease
MSLQQTSFPPVSRQRWLPYLALVAGVLALSMTSIFVRLSSAPGIVTTFFRMSIASIALAPFYFKQTGGKALPLRSAMLLAVLGGLLVACDHGLLSTSVGYTRIANATLMNNIAPLWVALAAWLLWKERLSPRFWLGLGLTLAGAVLVLGNDLLAHPAFSFGDGLAILSSLFYAAYFMVTQRARQNLSSLGYIWLVDVVAAVALLGLCLALGVPLSGYPTSTWLVFLGAGLISQGIGYFAVGYALGHLPAQIVAPSMVAQPLLTTVLAIPLAGEMLTPWQWLGACAVLAGIYLVNSLQSRTA